MARDLTRRGFCGIGVYHPKTEVNIGTLWRSASIYNANFIFTIGRRYEPQASDTCKTPHRIPLWEFKSFAEFGQAMPKQARLVFVEMVEGALDLTNFVHPQAAIYLLGAEDHGIPERFMAHHTVVRIPSPVNVCHNVAVAGSIVLHDRFAKETENHVIQGTKQRR